MGNRSQGFGTVLAAIVLVIGVAGISYAADINLNGGTLNYNKGGSKIYDNGHLSLSTDDYLLLNASKAVKTSDNLQVGNTLVIANRNELKDTGSHLYDDGNLHIKTDDYLLLDAKNTVQVSNDLQVRNALILANQNTGQDTGSEIFDNGQLNITTDDYLYLNAANTTFVQEKLHVGGEVRLYNDNGNIDTGSRLVDDMHLRIYTDDDLYLNAPGVTYIQGSLNVGGTISHDASSFIVLQASSAMRLVSAGSAAIQLDSDDNDSDTTAFTIGKNSTVLGSTTELFRVGEDGKVGVGTSSPSSNLHVVSSAAEAARFESTSATATSTSSALHLLRRASATSDGVGMAFTLQNADATNTEYAYIGALIEDRTASSEDGAIAFYTTTGGTTRQQRLTLTSEGRLGVNTNSPYSQLQVNGSSIAKAPSSTSGMWFGVPAATFTDGTTASSGSVTNAMFSSFGSPTYASSNTGITVDHASTVYLAGPPSAGTNTALTTSSALRIASGSATGTSAYGLYVSAPTGASANYAATFASGNVGIGDTSPAALLTVGASDAFQVDTAGAVTIGGGTAITKHLSGTGTIDFSSIATQTCATGTVTVTGAASGDSAVATPTPVGSGIDTMNLTWSAWVSSTNTVTVRACNGTSGSLDPASQTWRADVWQH